MREAGNNPEDPSAGARQVPFTRELYIEHDDFMLHPPPKYFRLSPGREVRLRSGLLRDLYRGWTPTPTGKSPKSAAPTTPRPDRARPLTAAR